VHMFVTMCVPMPMPVMVMVVMIMIVAVIMMAQLFGLFLQSAKPRAKAVTEVAILHIRARR
jgi:hypothetical protein